MRDNDAELVLMGRGAASDLAFVGRVAEEERVAARVHYDDENLVAEQVLVFERVTDSAAWWRQVIAAYDRCEQVARGSSHENS